MSSFQRIAWPLVFVLALSAGVAWHVATAQEKEKTNPGTPVPPKLEKASQESKVDPPRIPVERAVSDVEPKAAPAVQQWEYKSRSIGGRPTIFDSTLNELGAEGWELVAVTASSDDRLVAYMKRRK